MLHFEKKEYTKKIPTNIECVLGADIGGTNSNIGIFYNTNKSLKLLFSLHFKSQEIINFTDFTNDILLYLKKTYSISIKRSCFAAAGPVAEHRNKCKPTNLNFVIDADQLIKNTDLECATLANDFEIIGHGLMLLEPEKLIQIKQGKIRKTSARIIVGAGTGLGKCILQWHEKFKRSMPMPSEGGHADFSAQTQEELDLITFIQQTEHRNCNISWEDVLSGNGINRIYKFFSQQGNNKNIHKKIKDNGLHPDKIFANKDLDAYSKKTYELYAKLYARCIKNFALEALALGGIYIAGGIASKNLELFKQKLFINEFLNCGKQAGLLKNIPIYVIADYNVSLYGAAQFMMLEKTCLK
ncbi:glucokinase [bacterium]|nr:glucokinase [bacterium]